MDQFAQLKRERFGDIKFKTTAKSKSFIKTMQHGTQKQH